MTPGTDGGWVGSIYVASEEGAPMERVESVEAVAGRGLRGDRYFAETGYYTSTDACQVTLIEREALEAVSRDNDLDLDPGAHRRNIVTEGVALNHLVDAVFRVGDAVFSGVKLREPCAYLESMTTDGVIHGLLHRSGLCANVVESGPVEEGDPVAEIARGIDVDQVAPGGETVSEVDRFDLIDHDAVHRALALDSIAVVGFVPGDDERPPDFQRSLIDDGKTVSFVDPEVDGVHGADTYASLEAIEGPVELVNVWPGLDDPEALVEDAVDRGDVEAIWTQVGVPEGVAEAAERAGLLVVANADLPYWHKRFGLRA